MSSGAAVALKLFMRGLLDSISYHKAIPTLVNNNDALLLTLQILGANGLLIIGSYFFFHRAMIPVIGIIEDTTLNLNDTGHYNSLIWLLYQSLWLIPMCGLCYACSITWYQSLADAIHKQELIKANIRPAGTKSVEYAIYGTIAWAFVFLQVQLLTTIFPTILGGFEFVASKVFTAGDISSVLFSNLLHGAIVAFIRFLYFFSFGIGLVLMSVLYAWYAFDPKWISKNISPDERFAILEKHFSYFLGFGFPYVLLNKLSPFFVGFGGFLMLFPFCIILGSVTNYDRPYTALKVAPVQTFRIFKVAQAWTLQALKLAGSKLFKKEKGGSASAKAASSTQQQKEKRGDKAVAKVGKSD